MLDNVSRLRVNNAKEIDVVMSIGNLMVTILNSKCYYWFYRKWYYWLVYLKKITSWTAGDDAKVVEIM